jgi:capsular polysaccharide biosynthesis protein
MKNQEFSLYESLERVLARWWMMVILMIIGGLAGLVLHLFLPSIYEAKAVVTISMDFDERPLTQYEEDYAFTAAGAIINSSNVLNPVIADAQSKGYSLDPTKIADHFFLERKQSEWELRVRDPEPQVAAALANSWAQSAIDKLNAVLTHSIRAEQLQVQDDGLKNCLAGVPTQVAPPQLDCKALSQDQVQVMLHDDAAELVKEKNASLGIIPIMSFSLTDLAGIPGSPTVYGQGGLVFAGAFIGFLVSVWLINTFMVLHHD